MTDVGRFSRDRTILSLGMADLDPPRFHKNYRSEGCRYFLLHDQATESLEESFKVQLREPNSALLQQGMALFENWDAPRSH